MSTAPGPERPSRSTERAGQRLPRADSDRATEAGHPLSRADSDHPIGQPLPHTEPDHPTGRPLPHADSDHPTGHPRPNAESDHRIGQPLPHTESHHPTEAGHLTGRALPRAFFAVPSAELAPRLLGRFLVCRRGPGACVVLRITEVEAYQGSSDPGAHSYRGRTARNATMFGEAGHLYVYRHLGLHRCANIVADAPGIGTGVLLRAGEVVEGVEQARERRRAAGVTKSDRDLAQGPGRLTVACGIGLEDDGLDIARTSPDGAWGADADSHDTLHADLDAPRSAECGTPADLEIYVDAADPDHRGRRIVHGPRIGLRPEATLPERFALRFWLEGDSTVSGPSTANRAGIPSPLRP